MKLTTFFCFLLFLTTSVHAQEKDKYGRPPLVPGIAELKIGDQVPDILIDNIINNDKRSIRTSDYKDKLLVLDFWDTYCGTCIASMPKLDSLQKVFGDQIKLLSVTWQPEEMITKFFKTNRFLKEHKPPIHRASVVDDRALRSYFRYQTNPHVVWIYKGKVVAITAYDYVNNENIQALLDGEAVIWPLKNDNFDPMNPIMRLNALSEEVIESPYYSYSVLTGLSNLVPAVVGGINFKQDTIRNITRLALFNYDIVSAYQVLLYATKPLVNEMDIIKDSRKMPYLNTHPGRLILEINDLSRVQNDKQESQSTWNRKNLYCFEIEKHGIVDQSILAKLAVQDLNNRLNFYGRYEKRKVKCLVFVREKDEALIDTLPKEKGGMSIPALIMMRLDISQKYPPAINETGLGFDVEFNMLPDDGTLSGLRKEIQRHGLDLIEAEREIEVLVISDAK